MKIFVRDKNLNLAILGAAFLLVSAPYIHAQNEGLRVSKDAASLSQFNKPRPVLNQVPVAGEEIAILRTFRIEKGTFEEFYKQGVMGIWPYFEKIGARIIGMWLVDPTAIDKTASRDYDEVILLTRYASLEHWRASREAFKFGGNGPDGEAVAKARAYRL